MIELGFWESTIEIRHAVCFAFSGRWNRVVGHAIWPFVVQFFSHGICLIKGLAVNALHEEVEYTPLGFRRRAPSYGGVWSNTLLRFYMIFVTGGSRNSLIIYII